jgi:hypothetical protein
VAGWGLPLVQPKDDKARQTSTHGKRAAREEQTNLCGGRSTLSEADGRMTGLVPWVPFVSEKESNLVARLVRD